VFIINDKRKQAKWVGFLYLTIIATALLNMIFVDAHLQIDKGISNVGAHLLENEKYLRFSIAYEMIMFVAVVLLAVGLYQLLKTIDSKLAMTGMIFRVCEAIMGGVIVLVGLTLLVVLKNDVGLSPDIWEATVKLLIEVRSITYIVLFLFMCVGSMIFFYLMYKSSYVPKLLSLYGLATFLLILSWPFVYTLLPNVPESYEMFSLMPGALFEIAIGLWLLIKGVKMPNQVKSKIA